MILTKEQQDIILDTIAENLKEGIKIKFVMHSSKINRADLIVWKGLYSSRKEVFFCEEDYSFPFGNFEEETIQNNSSAYLNLPLEVVNDILNSCLLLSKSDFNLKCTSGFIDIENNQFRAALDDSFNWDILIKDDNKDYNVTYCTHKQNLYSFIKKLQNG